MTKLFVELIIPILEVETPLPMILTLDEGGGEVRDWGFLI